MHSILLSFHALVRWLVLASLLYAVYRAWKGYRNKTNFNKTDNTVRHVTATVAHIQLLIGMLLYSQSPLVKYFWANTKEAARNTELLFFGIIHLSLMLAAIVLITIGSALAKRRQTDREKFRTMFFWFSLALIIIFIAIPWPFSPLAHRPYFR